MEDAIRFQDQSTARMNSGDYEGALTLAQQALAILQGTGELYEGYANFNVGNSLAHLGRCDEAIPYLQRRLEWRSGRSEVNAALKLCAASGPLRAARRTAARSSARNSPDLIGSHHARCAAYHATVAASPSSSVVLRAQPSERSLPSSMA